MKKFFCLFLALVLLPLAALADLPDLSGLTFDELVTLRDQLNLAIWNSESWQEVTVPPGVYQIGTQIPAGHWTIKASSVKPGINYAYVEYCDALNESRTEADIYNSDHFYGETVAFPGTEEAVSYPTQLDIECVEGRYLIIKWGIVSFSPYAGKPDLGFK